MYSRFSFIAANPSESGNLIEKANGVESLCETNVNFSPATNSPRFRRNLSSPSNCPGRGTFLLACSNLRRGGALVVVVVVLTERLLVLVGSPDPSLSTTVLIYPMTMTKVKRTTLLRSAIISVCYFYLQQ